MSIWSRTKGAARWTYNKARPIGREIKDMGVSARTGIKDWVKGGWRTGWTQNVERGNEWRTEHTENKAEISRLSTELNRYRRTTGMDELERKKIIGKLMWQRAKGFGKHITHHPITRGLALPLTFGWNLLKGKPEDQHPGQLTNSSIVLFLLLAAVYHLIMIFGAPSFYDRLRWNIIVIVIATLFIFDRSERHGGTYRALMFCAMLELGIPFIISKSSYIASLDFVRLYIANSFVVLTYFYYGLLFRGRDCELFLVKALRIGVTLFWIFVFLSYALGSVAGYSNMDLDMADYSRLKAAGVIWDKAMDGFTETGAAIAGTYRRIGDVWKLRQKQITSSYYIGQVDENEQEKIGVYLEEITPSKKEFYQDEPITIFALLQAKTLEDVINVDVSCYPTKSEELQGYIYPDKTFEIFDLGEEEIDCSFDEYKFPVGGNKVTVAASFNFETIGYLKRYFTDRESYNAALRDGTDILSKYQITDKNPVARYTNGPVRLGIGPEAAVIGISPDYEIKPRLGVTLDANTLWDGKLNKIHEIIFIIPASMEFDLETCTDTNIQPYTQEQCVDSHRTYNTKTYRDCEDAGYVDSCLAEECTEEFDGYNTYYLDTSRNTHLYEDIEDFVTYSCRLNIIDYQELLGNTPIATRYFYIKARYDYQVEEETTIKVIESDTPYETTTHTAKTYHSNEEMLADIYNLYYAAEPYSVKTWSNFYNLDPNLIMAIIAAGSNNDPNEVQDFSPLGETKGLMQITTDTAIDMADKINLDFNPNDIYDPETNIRLGSKYLEELRVTMYPAYNPADARHLLAAYYGGVCIFIDDKQVGSFCPSTECPGISNYLCEDAEDYDQVRLFVSMVANFYSQISNSNLIAEGQVVSEYNDDNYLIEGTLDIDLDENSTEETPDGATKLKIEVRNSILYLNYSGEEKGYSFYPHYSGKWWTFEKNPSFSFKPTFDGNTLKKVDYKLLNKVITNTDYVFEGNPETEILTDLVWARYNDDQLTFYYKDEDGESERFCTMDWDDTSITEECKKDQPGFKARKIELEDKTFSVANTRFQFEYDPSVQLASAVS